MTDYHFDICPDCSGTGIEETVYNSLDNPYYVREICTYCVGKGLLIGLVIGDNNEYSTLQQSSIDTRD